MKRTLFGAVVADPVDGDPPAGEFGQVAGGGDAAQQVGDEPGDGLVRPFRRLQAYPAQGGDPAAALGVPGRSAVLTGGGAEFGAVGALGVVLVADLADELLDDVLQGDDPGGAAVLVDDDGYRLLVAQPPQQQLHGQGLGHQQRGDGDRAGRGAQALVGGDGEGVLEVDHADDLVDAVPVDREAGEAGGAGEVEDVLGGRGGVQGADLHPGGHDVLGGEPGQREGPYEEVGCVLFQGSGLG
ncbi:hypothetical protein SMICM304S_02855 [Streptomyces microflavus]